MSRRHELYCKLMNEQVYDNKPDIYFRAFCIGEIQLPLHTMPGNVIRTTEDSDNETKSLMRAKVKSIRRHRNKSK